MGLPEPLKTLPIMSRDTGVLSTYRQGALLVSSIHVLVQGAEMLLSSASACFHRGGRPPSSQESQNTHYKANECACLTGTY